LAAHSHVHGTIIHIKSLQNKVQVCFY